MMKKLTSLVLIVTILLSLGLLDAPTVQAATRPAYTILVYMVGSNLESEGGAASADLSELMEVGSTKKINVIVETGGSKKWKISGISNKVNQRWKINKGTMTRVKNNLGNRSMGKQSTLQDFLVWGVKTYPAQKYAVILWDHGAGAVNGFGYDDNNINRDPSLSLNEINGAFKAAKAVTKQKFSLVGFDACLMGNIETATCLKDYASYMVASEELEPGHGWDYTPMLKALNKTSTLTGAGLGKVIVDGYLKQAIVEKDDNQITLAVVDLAKVGAINTALVGLLKKASNDIKDPQKIVAVSKARTKAEDYGDGGEQGGATDMADLYDIAYNLKSLYPTEASNLMKSIKASITYKVISDTKPNANGLSIYFPCKDKENFLSNLKEYANSGYMITYQQFLATYVGKILADKSPIQLTQPDPVAANPDEQSLFQIQIAQNDISSINEIYSVLAVPMDDDGSTVIFLGMDKDVELNTSTGIVKDNFSGYWTTLGGEYVSMFIEDVGEDYCTYTIPAKLNGELVDIRILYNGDYPEGVVLGAWRGNDETTGMPDKNIIKISSGDKIVPQFHFYDTEDDIEGLVDGSEFVVGKDLKLEYTELPAGNYLYGFYITDMAQNDTYSDFCTINIDEDGNISTVD